MFAELIFVIVTSKKSYSMDLIFANHSWSIKIVESIFAIDSVTRFFRWKHMIEEKNVAKDFDNSFAELIFPIEKNENLAELIFALDQIWIIFVEIIFAILPKIAKINVLKAAFRNNGVIKL